MIIDSQLLFSNEQTITSTAASTNVVDLGAVRNLGVGEDLYLVVGVDVAMDDSGSDSTLAVTIETDDNEGFNSATVAQSIGTFSALSVAGTRLVAKLQPDKINERYMRLKYTPGTGDLSAGKFTAFLAKDIQAFTAYADGITIS